jgi:hypothetical protein
MATLKTSGTLKQEYFIIFNKQPNTTKSNLTIMKTKTILAFGVAIAALLLITVTGCKKKNSDAPVIEITSPADNATFTSGSTVTLEASISDDELHEVHVELMDHDADTLIQEWNPSVHGDQMYMFSYSFTPTVTAAREYHFEITAMDMDDNTSNEEHHFVVNP